MADVSIEALRPFNKTPQGDICEVGDTFTVDASRADELERLGLAKRAGNASAKLSPASDDKAAPAPSNKMKPGRSTKAVKLGG